MADDLKEGLKRVKKSEGVTYYWGYGTGKRKEPLIPGDGVLRVVKSRSKVQQRDFQGLCECKHFSQGVCWSAGEAIKFAGKGLGAADLAKMKTSADSETGAQYAFELATAEEAAAQALKEAAAGPESEAEEAAAPEGAPAVKAPVDAAAVYQTAVGHLSDDLKMALHLGGPAAQEIKQQYLQADAFFKQSEYKAALVQLVQLKRRVADALAAVPATAALAGGPDLGLWTAARADAVKHIRHFQAELLKTHDPECIEAAKMLEEVPTQLEIPLDSLQSVEALEQFVGEDELIALIDRERFFGVATDLRNSLRTTLGLVKKQFAPRTT